MKKSLVLLLVIGLYASAMAQTGSTNLFPLSEWVPGTGFLTGLTHSDNAQSSRVIGEGPYGHSAVLYQAESDGAGHFDGGWFSTAIPIDHRKTYRSTVWIKKLSTADGRTYLGCAGSGNTLYLNGSANNNPYFWSGDLPKLDTWYLLVGYIHGSGHTATTSYGAIYDGSTGEKVIDMTDYKNSVGATYQTNRSFLYQAVGAGVQQQSWNPRFEEVNGNEPPVSALLNGSIMGSGSDAGIASGQGTNLFPLTGWVPGNDFIPALTHSNNAQSSRIIAEGPYRHSTVLYQAESDGAGHFDGGWSSTPITIDHRKTYRSTVWIKKLNTADGRTYLGCAGSGNTLNLSGTTNSNPYFWSGDLPSLGHWYLLVGYIHGSGYASTTSYGGIYDGSTGEKVVSITDYKNSVGATYQTNRSFLYYAVGAGVQQHFWNPRFEEVNGNEPSISSLLKESMEPEDPADSEQIWQRAQEDITYSSGYVGIGTDMPDAPLTVRGTIHTSEVLVDLGKEVAPDYVFEPDYELMSLADIKTYIQTEKHLPEVPSATDMAADGINLKEMNLLLLKKVEELTLHLIKQGEEIEQLKKKQKFR